LCVYPSGTTQRVIAFTADNLEAIIVSTSNLSFC